jgi:phosphatidate cytidylyltransferase
MSETAPPAGSSDLTTRFTAAVVLVAIACAAIYWGGWPFRLLAAAAAGIMIHEWGNLHRVGRIWWGAGVALVMLALLLLSWRLFPPDQACFVEGQGEAIAAECFQPVWIGFAALVVLGLLVGLVSRRLAMATGFIYIAIPAFALITIEWADPFVVFWLMLVTWATDICAYFAGRAIGGPKLAPLVSPNKTWAGLGGGVAGALIVGAAAAYGFGLESLFLVLGAPMAVVAQLGDLYESWVKRRAGAKDSSNLIPGHGGVLDRLDGLLPVAFVTLIVLIASLQFS